MSKMRDLPFWTENHYAADIVLPTLDCPCGAVDSYRMSAENFLFMHEALWAQKVGLTD